MDRSVAVVTGGAKNIGLAIALRLQSDGYRVVVLDIVAPEDAGLRADAIEVDLTDPDATGEAARRIAAALPVSCLVNNVGIVSPALIEDVDIGDFDRLFGLNVRSGLIVSQAMIAGMRERGTGRIVMNTSRTILGKPSRTLYSATKGAMQSMARTWALELAADGITVNCVAPGPIATSAFWQNNPPDAERTRAIIDRVPVKRMGEPEDVANAVSFFCGAGSGFVTGQTLFVCGGVTVG